MSWFHQQARTWRLLGLALLVLALSGPWVYDLIHVPAAFTCSPPHVRLEGDFCGLPLSPLWLFSQVAVAWQAVFDQQPGAFLGFLSLLLILLVLGLPLLTGLLLVLRGSRTPLQVAHFVAWLLAFALGAYTWINMAIPPSGLWGLWIYPILALLMLVFEGIALVSRSRPAPG
jgi:hypothetical protein